MDALSSVLENRHFLFQTGFLLLLLLLLCVKLRTRIFHALRRATISLRICHVVNVANGFLLSFDVDEVDPVRIEGCQKLCDLLLGEGPTTALEEVGVLLKNLFD